MKTSLDVKTTTSKSEYLTLLPMCDEDNRETITDMFNPIYIGYQLFKRGFCLAYNNGDLNKEQKRSYPKLSDENFYEVTSKINPDPSNIEPTSWKNTLPQFSVSNGQPFEPFNDLSLFPVLSPNGLCIDNAAHVHFLKDKKVTCSYLLNDKKCPDFNKKPWSYAKAQSIFTTITNYRIENGLLNKIPNEENEQNKQKEQNKYIESSQSGTFCNNVIKKIEMIYYVTKTNTQYSLSPSKVNIYYLPSLEMKGNLYVDVTFDVSFRNEIEYVQRSGNPGYLPSHDILTGKNTTITITKDNQQKSKQISIVEIHKTKKIFGIQSDGTCFIDNDNQDYHYYYDDNLDNSLTFENSILFGCKIKKDLSVKQENKALSLYKMLYNLDENFRFSKNGNPNANKKNFLPFDNFGGTINLNQDKIANDENNNYIPTLNFLYTENGATNNTQNAIIAFRADDSTFIKQKQYSDNLIPKYIKINFFKHQLKKKWWYAPGPGFIKLPRNVMYPFRIGTTTYKTSSSS